MNINWRRLATVTLIAVAATLASLGTLAVTAAGFTLSFDAIRAVGIAAHIRQDWAWMLPVSVDGAMATATVVAIVMYRLTGKHRMYPWVVLAVGVIVSMASNALHSTGTAGQPLAISDPWVRAAVSTVPAAMLALSFHLLAMLVAMATDRVANGQTEDMDVDKVLDKWLAMSSPVVANGQAVDMAKLGEALANGQTRILARDFGQPAPLAKEDVDRLANGMAMAKALDIQDGINAMLDKQDVDMANGQTVQDVATEAEQYLAMLPSEADPLPRRKPAVAGQDSPKIDADRACKSAEAMLAEDKSLGLIAELLGAQYRVSPRTIRRQSWWPSISGRPVSGPPEDSEDQG